jgi:hypothetical protein
MIGTNLTSIILAAGVALGAASPSGGRSHRSGAPVALNLSAFSHGFRLCSRPTPERMSEYWQLSPTEVSAIDVALLEYLRSSGAQGRLSLPVELYQRQYLGFHRDNSRIVYVNAFPAKAQSAVRASAKEFIRGCDGGGNFWGVEYNPTTKTFASFAINLR